MNVQSGDAFTVTIPLGIAVEPDRASWWLEDEAGAVLIAPTPVPGGGFAVGAVTLTVPAGFNTLTLGQSRALRMVRVRFRAEDAFAGERMAELAYHVLPLAGLTLMANSFQPYNMALMLAGETIHLPQWDVADRTTRETALAEAFRVLVRLRYDLSCTVDRQSTLASEYPFAEPGMLHELTAEQFGAFDPRFVLALRRAQLLEAEAILARPDDLRAQGVLSATEGQASQMYRSGKPLERAISKRAAAALAGYLALRSRIVRI